MSDQPLQHLLRGRDMSAPSPAESGFVCPSCGSATSTIVVETSRGKGIKCSLEKGGCGWDSFRPEDWGTRKDYVRLAAMCFKARFPMLSLVTNLPFPANPLIGEPARERRRYDYKVYLIGHLLWRLRVCTVRHQSVASYLETPEEYVAGDPATVEYLAKPDRDAVLMFYFPDAQPKETFLLGEVRRLYPYLKEVVDRFGNRQYRIPVEVRSALLMSDADDQRRFLLAPLIDDILSFQPVI